MSECLEKPCEHEWHLGHCIHCETAAKDFRSEQMEILRAQRDHYKRLCEDFDEMKHAKEKAVEVLGGLVATYPQRKMMMPWIKTAKAVIAKP